MRFTSFPRFDARKRLCFVFAVLAAVVFVAQAQSRAQVCNLKVVTDASPDYTDIGSMIYSITSRWDQTKDKCWALWYWNHIARRQTAPMILYGRELTDPIRQFNDYGHAMCSTIAGINCAIWGAMGLEVKFWDISLHTVPEVMYDGRWHMYDNSLSAIYTLCDGKTIAGVEDIGAERACAASGGKIEPGHIARYHCLAGTSPNGFLAGCDTIRSLAEEYRCFNPRGLKYRDYLNNWDLGHRYILNLRQNEVYTRWYHRLDADSPNAVAQGDKRPDFRADPAYYVPNEKTGKDPESVNPRYRIRSNGLRDWSPVLTASGLSKTAHAAAGIKAIDPSGVEPIQGGKPGEIVFKIEGANVITSLAIKGSVTRKTADDLASIAVSTTNGLEWKEVWRAEKTGQVPVELRLIEPVNGAYEVLAKVTLLGKTAGSDAQLRSIAFQAVTQLNSKTLPALRLGKNTIYVGAGDATESVVFSPDLSSPKYKSYVVEEKNVRQPEQRSFLSSLCAEKGSEDAYVVFRIDTPTDISRVTYGGRFYNRGLKAHIDLLHSFDGGKTWTRSYTLTDTTSPYDVIHYEKVASIPPGTKSVLFKYLWSAYSAGPDVCGLYGVRMEANHLPADAAFKPLDVTFAWKERQADYSAVARSHTRRVDKLPCTYEINVGGADHPVMESLRIHAQDASAAEGSTPAPVKYGYSDGKDIGDAMRFQDRWVTYGKNLAEGKPYISTVPSREQYGANDGGGKILTDGIVGSPYTGGAAYKYGVLWNKADRPAVTVDLGQVMRCAAFRIQTGGYPFYDALKGEVQDKVEVLTSADGQQYASQGFFDFRLRWKDIPVNDVWPDEEALRGPNYLLVAKQPAMARYVRFAITPGRGGLAVSELQVLDSLTYEPFDLKLALPDGTDRSDTSAHNPKHVPSKPRRSKGPGKQAARESAPQAEVAVLLPASAGKAVGNAAEPAELIEEMPTLKCLGVRWMVAGDGNRNARIAVAYRKTGSEEWRSGLDLFRVETSALREPDRPPAGQTMFAGSVFGLEENTEYEVKLSLGDPDGGNAERTLRMKTWAEPRLSPGAAAVEVYPGQLAEALLKTQPGQVLRLHQGLYRGTFRLPSGTPAKPIGIVAAGDGEAILDGQGASNVIEAPGVHDLMFEGLTVQNARWAIAVSGGANLVFRRCLIRDVEYGFVATRNAAAQHHILIADNVFIGRSSWPRTQGIEDRRAVQIAGTGHAVCYNRVSRFGDAIDTFSTYPCAAIDFYGNDISECTDDGIEMDYSEHNTRCFDNRLTNVFQGISVQPVHGGPVYVFRNAIYNVGVETFKMHNHPSGAIFFHNTSVKAGMPLVLSTNSSVSNCVYRNNLFLGTTASHAYESTARMLDCDFDFDGFGGQWKVFLKWNGVRYATMQEAANSPSESDLSGLGRPSDSGAAQGTWSGSKNLSRNRRGGPPRPENSEAAGRSGIGSRNAPAYQHAVRVNPDKAFVSRVKPPDAVSTQFDVKVNDLRLAPASEAVDAGVVLPNVNDGYRGKAPDLGAFELGAPLPHYGPRAPVSPKPSPASK